MVERSRPSILDWLPPVTRPITLASRAGPLKVALSLVTTVKVPKLWKRLSPRWPDSAPMRSRPHHRSAWPMVHQGYRCMGETGQKHLLNSRLMSALLRTAITMPRWCRKEHVVSFAQKLILDVGTSVVGNGRNWFLRRDTPSGTRSMSQ